MEKEMAKLKMEESESEEEEYSDEMDESESEGESEEETICDRVEVDRGHQYVLEDGATVTRPKVATKMYFRSGTDDALPLQIVHKRYEFPLSTFSKLALDRYNHIEGTNYEYVGLVKAYSRALAGFRFWIRFKACLPASQHDQINFQAILFRGLRDHITNAFHVDVEFVYPLPNPPAPVVTSFKPSPFLQVMPPVNLLAQQVSGLLS